MSKFSRRLAVGLSAAVCLTASAAANAATVEFGPTGWVDQNGAGSPLAYVSVLTDSAANTINVDVDLQSGQLQTGDILLIGLDGFDFPDTDPATTTTSNVVTNTGDGVTQLCYDTLSCGGGGNFNGGSQNALLSGQNWDLILQIGVQGSSTSLNTQVEFDLTAIGLDAMDITAMGLRVQTVGEAPGGGTGSLKLYNFNRVIKQEGPPPPVPLPAALWLIISALGSLGIFGWSKQKLAIA